MVRRSARTGSACSVRPVPQGIAQRLLQIRHFRLAADASFSTSAPHCSVAAAQVGGQIQPVTRSLGILIAELGQFFYGCFRIALLHVQYSNRPAHSWIGAHLGRQLPDQLLAVFEETQHP